MNADKIVAGLQLSGTRVVDFHFQNDFVTFNGNFSDSEIDIDYKIINIEEQEELKLGILQLYIKAGFCDHENSKLLLNLTFEGGFYVPVEVDNDVFSRMLCINGTACLFSIARSFVLSVSSLSFAGGNIILPLINTFKLHESVEDQKKSQ